jgi:hypothetical protein
LAWSCRLGLCRAGQAPSRAGACWEDGGTPCSARYHHPIRRAQVTWIFCPSNSSSTTTTTTIFLCRHQWDYFTAVSTPRPFSMLTFCRFLRRRSSHTVHARPHCDERLSLLPFGSCCAGMLTISSWCTFMWAAARAHTSAPWDMTWLRHWAAQVGVGFRVLGSGACHSGLHCHSTHSRLACTSRGGAVNACSTLSGMIHQWFVDLTLRQQPLLGLRQFSSDWHCARMARGGSSRFGC